MKNRLPLLALLACFATGCFSLTEEYYFNADKSGRYVATYDLSRMITMTGKMRQSFEKQRDSLISVGAPLVIDSSFYVFEREPDSLRRLVKNAALFDRYQGRIRLDYSKKQMSIQFSFDFKDLAELRLFQQQWRIYQHLKDSLKVGAPVKSDASDLPATDDFQKLASETLPEMHFDGRNFSIFYQFSPDSKGDYSHILSDDSAFVRNMLKSFKYNIIFHFPKKIKKVSGEGFTTVDKTVSYKSDFFDMLKIRDSGLKLKVKLKK